MRQFTTAIPRLTVVRVASAGDLARLVGEFTDSHRRLQPREESQVSVPPGALTSSASTSESALSQIERPSSKSGRIRDRIRGTRGSRPRRASCGFPRGEFQFCRALHVLRRRCGRPLRTGHRERPPHSNG